MDLQQCRNIATSTSRAALTWVPVSLVLLVHLSGCATHGEAVETPTSRVVDVQAFSSSESPPTSRPAPTDGDRPVSSNIGEVTEVVAPTQPAPPSSDATNTAQASRAPVIGQEHVVESVVGQVSGRPIFADSFLSPIHDQLRSESQRLNQEEFINRAREIIAIRLRQVVVNELFLAEAEASLTPQQQMGLLAFLRDMQEKSVAERGGTLFAAQRQIAEEQEMTLEEYQEAQKNEALIRNLIFERVSPRVIVSWRDVQREYELRKAEFNPPATITLRRLSLDVPADLEMIDKVTSRFAAGATFDQVIQEFALEDRAGFIGTDGRFIMTNNDPSSVGLADVLKTALAKIKPEVGQTTEAITRSSGVQWLTIAAIEQPPPKTLFDVQEQLITELQARRFGEEQRKYIDSLMEKGIFDEIDTMTRRLLAVAILRYRK